MRRREFLAAAATAAVAGLQGDDGAEPVEGNLRGAIYFPTEAWNAYQMWRDYRPAVIERDFSYARRLGLNALRLYLGYEFWKRDPDAFWRRADHLMAAADRYDLELLPICFDSVGVEPTPETLHGEYPTRSPSHEVILGDWSEPRRFVRAVAERYDPFALELVNEPGGWRERERFTADMVRTARCTDPTIPLTVGHKDPKYWTDDVDAVQFHMNHPWSTEHLYEEVSRVAGKTDRPVWLTEWQRVLDGPNVPLPDYATLASTIRGSRLDGDFFWQLMYQPGFMLAPRGRGNMDGVFYPDGSVYSREDFEALRVVDPPTPTRPPVVRDPGCGSRDSGRQGG